MAVAAEQLDFERAAELRDALRHLERMEEPTVVLQVEGGDRDVVGYARDGDDAVVAVLRVRGGKLLAQGTPVELSKSSDAYVLELLRTPRRQVERLNALLPQSGAA
jgi:excinuclease UvrABC nuclease subunit